MKKYHLWALDVPNLDPRGFQRHGLKSMRLYGAGDGGSSSSSGSATTSDPFSGFDTYADSPNVGAAYGPSPESSYTSDPAPAPEISASGFLGENVPSGVSNWDTAASNAQTTQQLYDNVLSGTASRSDLDVLSERGFGGVAGNPNNPDQTVDQRIAADQAHNLANTVAPYVINAIPGVGLGLAAIGLAQGKGMGAFNTLDTIREAIELNRQEQAGGPLSPAPSVAEQLATTTPSTGFFDYGGDGGSTPAATPTVSPSLATVPGGVAGLGAGLPAGKGYSNAAGVWGSGPGVAGGLGGFGVRKEDEEEQQKSKLFSTVPAFEEGGMIGPGGTPMIGGMPDPGRMPAGAGLRTQPMGAAANPQMAGMQAKQFMQQQPQQVQQIRQMLLQEMQSGEITPQELNTIVQLAQVVSQNPSMYPYARNFLLQQGILDEQDLPPQLNAATSFLMTVLVEAAKSLSGSAASAQGTAPPMESMAQGGTVPDSKKRSGGVIIEAHEGEYVIPAHIVRQKGTDFFDKLIGKDVKSEKGAA